MKKLGLFALALALVLGLSQCKKENVSSTNDDAVKVPITLNVSGDNGSRVAVDGSTGMVTFEDGDVLHVVSNGTYVGTLTYNGTQFSGEITEPTVGKKLQFYFLGNKTPEFNSNNTGCSVVINDQTTELPVISYAPSRENYQVGKTDYNATLLNKCALVKFDITTASNAATCIMGLNNKVTVTFATNEFTYGQEDEGIITLPAFSGEKWAILLPQEAITSPLEAVSSDGVYCGNCDVIQPIEENDYLTEGIAVSVVYPQGALKGAFSVSATQQVYFSQGNLQYIGSAATPYWKFADHQWDYLGNNGQGSTNQYVDRDLFGWGTSGWDNGNLYYRPWDTQKIDNTSQGMGYGPTNGSSYQFDLTGDYANADWGVYNAISNGGNTPNVWRTLTYPEWNYVINDRNTPSGIRWTGGRVNGIYGYILLPDNWSASIYALNGANSYTTSNIITADDWVNILEANGAVFLPCAGMRVGTSVLWAGSDFYYWSASYYDSGFAYRMGMEELPRSTKRSGHAVRLVRDAE